VHFGLPYVLIGLLALPVLLAAHLWQLRRKRRTAVRFSNVALLRTVVPSQ
jgi:Ca-activated chloride channel family protein